VPCQETETVLSALGSSQGAIFDHHWTGRHQGVVVLDTTALLTPISGPGWYVHTVTNKVNGCIARDSVQVVWDAPIQAVLAVEAIQCFGDADGTIRIQNISGGTPPFHYSIDNQNFSLQNTFSGLTPGDYPIQVRDDFGCQWESLVSLTEPEQLSVVLTASDTAIELGQYVYLTALPTPAGAALAEISWYPDDINFEAFSLRQRVQPEAHTAFQVRIVDRHGCVAEDKLQVSVYNHHIYIPNVIYPGRGDNGWFTVYGGEAVREVRLMRIFDRWGDLLFERQGFPLNDPTSGWDGSVKGELLNPGVFVWYAEVLLHDGRVLFFKGDVTVVR
jgi:hypothetical protein